MLINLKFLWIKEILWEFEWEFFPPFFFPLPAQKDSNTTKFVVQNTFLKAQLHEWLWQQLVSISGPGNYCYQEKEWAAVPALFAPKQDESHTILVLVISSMGEIHSPALWQCHFKKLSLHL